VSVEQSVASGQADVDAPAARAIERRAGVGAAEFRRDYLLPRRPLILSDAAREWPLYGRATPDYFRNAFGAHVVRVKGVQWQLHDLLDALQRSSVEQPGPYPCKFEIAREFPALLAEVTPRLAFSLPDRQAHALVPQRLFNYVNNLEIFFGGPGGEFPYLHYDMLRMHAWITQLHGDKEFTLYAPGQEHLLYVNPDTPWQSLVRNHHHPDYEQYPLFRQARAQRVVLRPGETLFLPCGWWHTARSLNMTISVAFDQLGPDNWTDFIGDVVAEKKRERQPLRAFAVGAYLHAIRPLLRASEWLGGNQRKDWNSR